MNPEEPLDVNGDGNVRAIDALIIINYLNLGEGSGEGESDVSRTAYSASLHRFGVDSLGLEQRAERLRRQAVDDALLELVG